MHQRIFINEEKTLGREVVVGGETGFSAEVTFCELARRCTLRDKPLCN